MLFLSHPPGLSAGSTLEVIFFASVSNSACSVRNERRLLVFSINISSIVWVTPVTLLGQRCRHYWLGVNQYCCAGSAAAQHQFTPDEDGVCFRLHPDLLIQDILPSLHF